MYARKRVLRPSAYFRNCILSFSFLFRLLCSLNFQIVPKREQRQYFKLNFIILYRQQCNFENRLTARSFTFQDYTICISALKICKFSKCEQLRFKLVSPRPVAKGITLIVQSMMVYDARDAFSELYLHLALLPLFFSSPLCILSLRHPETFCSQSVTN